MRKVAEPKFLTQDEIRRLFGAITNKRDRAMFLVAYRHGMRASEVGLLQVGDIDWRERRIYVRRLKGSLSGVHRLQVDELRLLKAHISPSASPTATVFDSNRRLPISRDQLHKLMRKYGEVAGIPPEKRHFHCLKHSIATHLLEAGMGIEFVQDWLGHACIRNTQIYAKITNPQRDKGADLAFQRLMKF